MQSYYDVVTDSGNRPIAGAQVFVYNYDGTLATLYGDQALLSTTVLTSNGTPYIVNQDLLSPQSNPIVTGVDGKFLFFAANGVYSVVITADAYDTRTLVATLNDPTPPTPSVSPYATFSLSSSAPNATTNAVQMTPTVSTVNGDLVLRPKGNGALLGNTPDSAIAGGNKRGTYAVDWQQRRAVADQVASGTHAVIGGGYSNRASGDYAAVGGGDYNWATGFESVIAGGVSNATSGAWASVLGGATNAASGQYSGILSGKNHTATGAYSSILGGSYGTTRGITGYQASPASNAPINVVAGTSQSGLLVLGVQTTDATPTVLRSDSGAADATNQYILQNNSAGMLNIDLIGWDGTDYLTMNGINVLIVRGLGVATTTLKSPGYLNYEKSAGASAWAVALAANITNGGLAVTVTGAAGKTIRWVCRILSTEVSI